LQELRAIVPELPSVPVQPVIIASQEEPGMFGRAKRKAVVSHCRSKSPRLRSSIQVVGLRLHCVAGMLYKSSQYYQR
jgi:hypothetical protein